MYQLYYQDLQDIANIAGVPQSIVDAMFVGNAVGRAEALIVLEVFSQRTGEVWNLDNVKVPLLPTLADLSVSPGFDANTLSQQASVPFAVLDKMLCGHPVSKKDAVKVLDTLSRQSGQWYTLDTVAVHTKTGEEGRDDGKSEVAL
jgi:hypothetical protein